LQQAELRDGIDFPAAGFDSPGMVDLPMTYTFGSFLEVNVGKSSKQMDTNGAVGIDEL